MQQQLEQRVTATASVVGDATFVFPAVAQGLTWWGTIQIVGAPFSSLQSVLVTIAGVPNEGTPWGTWAGPLAYGLVRAEGRQQVTVTASQLIPGVTYDATWLGISDDSLEPVPEFPTAIGGAQNFPTQAFLFQQLLTGAGQTVFPIQNQTLAYSVSNVKGMRVRIVNLDIVALVVILAWYSGATFSNAAEVGQRTIVIPAAGTAFFTTPHLGDFLQVFIRNADSSAKQCQVILTNVDSAAAVFSGVFAGGANQVPEALIVWPPTLVVPGALLTVASSSTVYAGPACWNVQATNVLDNPTWVALLQAQDVVGLWNTIARMDQDSNGNTGGTMNVVVPPAALRVQVQNGDVANHTMASTLIADAWR